MNTTCVPPGRLGVQRDEKNPWQGEKREGKGGCQICCNLQLLHLCLTPLLALISCPYQEVVGGRKRDIKFRLGFVLNVKVSVSCSDCCVQMKAKS